MRDGRYEEEQICGSVGVFAVLVTVFTALGRVAAIVSCLLLTVSYFGPAHPAVPGGTSAAACGGRLG